MNVTNQDNNMEFDFHPIQNQNNSESCVKDEHDSKTSDVNAMDVTSLFIKQEQFVCRFCTQAFTCSEELWEHLDTHEPRLQSTDDDAVDRLSTCSSRSDDDCLPGPVKVESETLIKTKKLEYEEPDSMSKAVPVVQSSENVKHSPNQSVDGFDSGKHQATPKMIFANIHKYNTLEAEVGSKSSAKVSDVCENIDDAMDNVPPVPDVTKPLECDACGKRYKRRYNLQQHIKMQHGSAVVEQECDFECGICSTCFPHKRALEAHQEQLHTIMKQDNVFQCSVCGRSFKRHCDLKTHFKTHRQLHCAECDITFNRYATMWKHMKRHQTDHKCDVCGEVFLNERTLARHKNAKRCTKNVCSVCSKTFASQDTLRRHVMCMHSDHSRERPWLCDVCGQCFKQKNTLREHKICHKNEKSIKCTICSEMFINRGQLRYHMVRHSDVLPSNDQRVRPFKCDICKETFSTHTEKTMHVRNQHVAEKPHKCDKCGERFLLLSQLKQHNVRRHESERFRCDECPCSYSHEIALVAHKRRKHPLNDVDFEICPECNKTFETKRQLQNHSRTHSSERPFACRFCSKTFRHALSLRGHERTHTGEKPYKCDQCDKAFAHRSNLIGHVQRHHVAACK